MHDKTSLDAYFLQFAESYTASAVAPTPRTAGPSAASPRAAHPEILVAESTAPIDCPGEASEFSGSTNTSLCHGTPVYQRGGADGPVLYQYEKRDGRTWWGVYDSSALRTCTAGGLGATAISTRPADNCNYQPGGGPPTAPAYGYSTGGNGWEGGDGWDDRDASPSGQPHVPLRLRYHHLSPRGGRFSLRSHPAPD